MEEGWLYIHTTNYRLKYTGLMLSLMKHSFALWNLEGKTPLYIYIGSFYRRPSCTTENYDNLNSLLGAIAEQKFSHVLLLGDFNYPKIGWKTISTTAVSTQDKELKFIEKLRDCSLVQHITEPTRGRVQKNITPGPVLIAAWVKTLWFQCLRQPLH